MVQSSRPLAVGAAGGALLAGPAADRLGRRGALRWNCLTLILAAGRLLDGATHYNT